MPHPNRIGRWLLVLTHALTTVLIDAGHHHGIDDANAAECQAACQAPGAHLSGHPSPNLESIPQDCPACHVRSHQIPPPTADGLILLPHQETTTPTTQAMVGALIPRSREIRGPPLHV